MIRPPLGSEISTVIVSGAVRIMDLLLLVAAAILTLTLYEIAPAQRQVNWIVAILATFAAVNLLNFSGFYEFERLRATDRQIRLALGIWTLTFIGVLLSAFFLKISDQLSRGWIALWYVAGGVFLTTGRLGLAALLKRWTTSGRLTRKLVVVGAGEIGQRFIAHIQGENGFGVDVIGVFDDRLTRVPEEIGGIHIAGDLGALVAFCRSTPVQTVVIALPLAAEARIVELLQRLSPLPVDVKLLPDLAGFQLLNKRVSYLAQLPVLNAFDRPMKDWGELVKRAEDLVLGSLITIAIAPLMAVIACAIKIDSKGPVFFRQNRYGFNNQMIEVLKFRTMFDDRADLEAATLVTRNDDRVTRLGRILRRSSLDELPQIFNVLLGSMSLVGPRPHAVNAKAANLRYDEAVANYAARHRVKPGITGWAQINGYRGETDTLEKIEGRVEHDLYYIDRWSPSFDLWILFLTIFKGFISPNAY